MFIFFVSIIACWVNLYYSGETISYQLRKCLVLSAPSFLGPALLNAFITSSLECILIVDCLIAFSYHNYIFC